MTLQATIDKLLPLHQTVESMYLHCSDTFDKSPVLPNPGYESDMLERWRKCVRAYLEELQQHEPDVSELQTMKSKLEQRLETGFSMPLPKTPREAWKHGRHFDKLRMQYEVCCNLIAGHDATRYWLLCRDYRLRYLKRRLEGLRNQLAPKQGKIELVLT